MRKTIDHLKSLYQGVRDTRIDPTILDGIKVECYGSLTDLKHLCYVGIQQQALIVSPYDAALISEINKAILKADIGLFPQIANSTLRIPIPKLYEKQRLKYIKHAKKLAEDSKIAIRNIRRKALKKWPEEKASVEAVVKKYIKQIDKLFENKSSHLKG